MTSARSRAAARVDPMAWVMSNGSSARWDGGGTPIASKLAVDLGDSLGGTWRRTGRSMP